MFVGYSMHVSESHVIYKFNKTYNLNSFIAKPSYLCCICSWYLVQDPGNIYSIWCHSRVSVIRLRLNTVSETWPEQWREPGFTIQVLVSNSKIGTIKKIHCLQIAAVIMKLLRNRKCRGISFFTSDWRVHKADKCCN